MKIYQIHEYGGSYEDTYNYIRFTYLDKEKAQIKKEELEAQELIDRKCSSCPLDYCPTNCTEDCCNCNEVNKLKNTTEYCDRFEIERIEFEDSSDDNYIKCKNYSSHYDNNTYEIEEIDVIE